MTNFPLPLAAALVLLVLLSLILLRHFRASNASPRRKRQREPVSEGAGYSYTDSNGYFSIRDGVASCNGTARSEDGDAGSGSVAWGASEASDVDGGRGAGADIGSGGSGD